jgi:hypothetical protein
MFDACYYINLDRNTERNDAFQRRWRAVKDWPFPEPVRIPGVEADNPPPQWKTGNAWGCMMAHLNVHMHALTHGHNSVVVFEDDACFSNDFGGKVRRFMEIVPSDWQEIYLGGHHDLFPRRAADGVLLCRRTVGSWAYIMRGQALAWPFAALARFPHVIGDDNCHIDTLWGSLHQWGKVRAYAPDYWPAGHAEGNSDRTGLLCETDYYFQLTDAQLASLTKENE